MSHFTYQCMWPVLDDSLTLPQLAEEAAVEMAASAAAAGAYLAGPPRFALGTDAEGRSILSGHAKAVLRPTGVLVARIPAGPTGFAPRLALAKNPEPVTRRELEPVACGTEQGFMRHRHLREEKCRPCLDAHAAHERERVARAREQVAS